MLKLTLTLGLPGSGKTTWTRDYIKDKPMTVVICRDDIRQMLNGGSYIFYGSRESMILEMRTQMALIAAATGYDVVLDETMANPKHLVQIIDVFRSRYGADVFISGVYFDTDAEECKLRRSHDTKGIDGGGWSAIIDGMAKAYVRPDPTVFDEFITIKGGVL